MILSTLNLIKKYINNILYDYQLKTQTEDNSYKLQQLNTFIGWIPPQHDNVTETIDEIINNIPAVIISIDEIIDEVEKNIEYKIRLTVVVYDDGTNIYVEDDDVNEINTNYNGYMLLINTLDKIKSGIYQNRIVDNKIKINEIIKTKINEEQAYPYWIGDMSIIAENKGYSDLTYNKYL